MSAGETPSFFSDDDLYLFAEGSWLDAYRKLGAHARTVDGVDGTQFAVWAPGAAQASVIGDFNAWQADRTPMTPRGQGGIWEVFVPGLAPGALYKYALTSRYTGERFDKADPYAFFAEVRPNTASIVYDIGGYAWSDGDWMSERESSSVLDKPLSVYEVHAGSWRRGEGGRFLTYRELAHELVDYVADHGFTHIEFMPLTEHPFDVSWGYQTTGYYAPTSRFGTPHDFMYLVDRCHQRGIGVLMDWVPSHFAKEGHGLGYFDGTHLYEHADPRQGEHLGWGTYVFNYGKHEVLTFLLSNAHYWLAEYHIDGFRIDAVAATLYLDYDRPAGQWVPNKLGGRENLEAVDFLQRFNTLVHTHHGGVITCAEESTTWPGVTKTVAEGGLGFDLKWNMGWMNDTLAYIKRDPIYRSKHHNEITFSYTYAFSERYILPLSHDEVVHLKRSIINKVPGDEWQRFATIRALYAMMFGHPGKKLLFMGDEFAQTHEWAYAGELEWFLLHGDHGQSYRQMQEFVTQLNALYRAEPALHERDNDERGFAWIDGSDADHSIVATLRRAIEPDNVVAVVSNWTPLPRTNYEIGVPSGDRWIEVLNSDDARFGGSGVNNSEGVKPIKAPLDGYPYTLSLTLPPLGVLWLKPAPAKRRRSSQTSTS